MNSPYYAQINFSIDVCEMLPDGSLSPNRLTISELESYGISNKAVFGISGFNKEDCIEKLKQILGQLKYEETR